MMTWAQLGLQDAVAPVMEEYIFFHDFSMVVLVFIISFVAFIMVLMLYNNFVNLNLLESQVIECVWTMLPGVMLVQVAVPSLMLLYMLDEAMNTSLTLKTIGHQWYWSYEYSELWSKENNSLEFDSYMASSESGSSKKLMRLLDVDNRVVLPYDYSVRVLITSEDVLHSWAVPALGVKADASPGRLNQMKFLSYRPGMMFGECSEICGANHSFMPIAVELVGSSDFVQWAISGEY